mgnify:CR=1 FL=1
MRRHVEDARARGAAVLAGGRARPDLGPAFFERMIGPGVTRVKAGGLRVNPRLGLEPGRYQIRVGARETVGGRVGSCAGHDHRLAVGRARRPVLARGGRVRTPGLAELADRHKVTLLMNQSTFVTTETGELAIVGVDDPSLHRADLRCVPVPAPRRFTVLLAHGVLHLLGYDHMEPDEEKEMFGLQQKLIEGWRSAPRERRTPRTALTRP